MMGVVAEFERAMIQERVRAGLARARSEGTTLGRQDQRHRRGGHQGHAGERHRHAEDREAA